MEYSEEECVVCGEYIALGRVKLGYDTCIKHGESRRTFTAVPVPKSNYIIATNTDQVKSPYSHKGNR
jgi:hypothetical protein